MKKEYWLAEVTSKFPHGSPAQIKLADGAHNSPEGVAQAQKIIRGLKFLPQDREFVMVTIEAVPDTSAEVNQEAINSLNQAASTVAKNKKP